MPRLGSGARRDRDELRSSYDQFDREMSALVQLYNERATASGHGREEIEERIATAEARVRGAWSRLGEAAREPLATHF